MKLLLILTLLLAGCTTEKPIGKKLGTMTMYRTENGSITIVNDQDGNSMVFDFRLQSVLTLPKAK